MYKDENIKKLVQLLSKRNRPIENLIFRAEKLGIESKEVINSMDLLLDLKVVKTEVVETGDGWNTRDKVTRFVLS
jgi:hypothetical protein